MPIRQQNIGQNMQIVYGDNFENDNKVYPFPVTLEYGSLYPQVTLSNG